MSTFDKIQILNYALENGIIDVNTIQMQIEMNERKKYLDMHPYKIWQGKNGKWNTYLPTEQGGRELKVRTTQKAIEDLVIASVKKNAESPTVKDIFYEWSDKRLEREEIEKSTYSRYERCFEQCFGEIRNKEIKKVLESDIEDFLKSAIHKLQLSQKSYSNMRTIVYGVFRYAKKKGLINYSIKQTVGDIQFSKKEFTKKVHEDNEQVFMLSEEKKMIEYLESHLDLINLGLLLIFKSGLRIGELVSLKKSDVCGNKISITKTETIYKENGEVVYDVKPFPKTEAGIRDVFIPDNYLWIFKEIKKLCPFGEYLFMNNGERIRSYVFRTRIYTLCKQLGIVVKSPHKIRKTYGSILWDSENISDAFIMEQMGHTDISCLKKHYYYNRMEDNEKSNMLNEAAVL